MKLNLHELLQAVDIDGPVRVRIWSNSENDYIFDKLTDDFGPLDLFAYSRTICRIYPLIGSREMEIIVELEETK